MIYNIRIDRDNRKGILERLKNEKTISFGWGGGNDKNLSLKEKSFRKNTKDYYKLKTTRIPTSLTKIKNFKKGDLLVIPNFPKDKNFVICEVAEDFNKSYYHEPNDNSHQNHRLKISRYWGVEPVMSFYNHHVSSWYGRLKWMRLPILDITKYENDFRRVIDLYENGEKINKSSLNDYLLGVKDDIISFVAKKLEKIDSSNGKISFEKICEDILKNNGYSIKSRNKYDGKGGDVDLRCSREVDVFTPFENGTIELYVQIKKHKPNSKTSEKAVKQVLEMMDDEKEGCVMTLANEFTEQAQELADENGIVLMNGETISELLVKSIMKNN